MNFIELIFALLKNFVPMETARFASLQKDGDAWYKGIDETSPDTNKIVSQIKKYGELWFVQVAFACSFIFLNKTIHDFMTSTEDDEDDE